MPITDLSGWSKAASPRQRKRKRRKKSNTLPAGPEAQGVATHNRFDGIENDDSGDDISSDEGNTTEDNTKGGKKSKIPPLVIYTQIKDHVKTLKEMTNGLIENLNIKSKRNRLLLYTYTLEDYNQVKEILIATNTQFHTYTVQDRSQITSILKGLPANITPEDIKEDLVEQNMTVVEVKQFNKSITDTQGKKSETLLPVFSVKFGNNTKLPEIKNINKVCYCRITWEKYKTKKQVMRCYKCQSYQHIAKNCWKQAICALCAGDHNTKDCAHKNEKHKCVHCSGEHQAGSEQCPIFIRESNRRNGAGREKQRSGPAQTHQRQPEAINVRVTNTTPSMQNPRAQTRQVNSERNTDFTERQHETTHDVGQDGNDDPLLSIWEIIKLIMSNFDMAKLAAILKRTVVNITKSKSLFNKIGCIMEGLAALLG